MASIRPKNTEQFKIVGLREYIEARVSIGVRGNDSQLYRAVTSSIGKQPHRLLIGTLETVAIAEALVPSPAGPQTEVEGTWHEVPWVSILVDR